MMDLPWCRLSEGIHGGLEWQLTDSDNSLSNPGNLIECNEEV
jgi:hypothetical protein